MFRPEIAEYVSNSKIWTDPNSAKPLELCPWLRKSVNSNIYICDIYHDRPEDCRIYPSNIAEMIRDECEMLETKDLDHPNKARQDLDVIMIDNRLV